MASLLQNLRGSSKNTNTVISLKSCTKATTSTSTSGDIPIITIDEENPVLTEEPPNSNTNLGKNPDDMENRELLTVESATGSTEATVPTTTLPDENSRSSEDSLESTLELLHDFGKVFTDHTIDVDKDIPSEPVLDPAARPWTSPSEKEKIRAPIHKTQVPTILNEHTDETCQYLPGTGNEIEHELKNIGKNEISDTPVIKSEQGSEVKLEPENVASGYNWLGTKIRKG